MCGIAGALSLDGQPIGHDAVRAMTDALAHRGPDEGAVRLLGAGAGIGRAAAAIGHRRLKVIDLSSAAAQPMRDAQDTGCLVYNGELYNTAALRKALLDAGRTFRSRSDTEVVLQAFLHWGVEEALGRFHGMFALAFWDNRERRLTLARDRFGEKPLYYAESQGRLLFASEIDALLAHGGVDASIDPEAVELYLTFGWIPAPWTIYRAVRKLPHAACLSAGAGGWLRLRRYYRLEDRLNAAASNPTDASAGPAAESVRVALEAAVKARLESDVPLGAYLSGGIDSSAVVTMMARLLPEAPRTYSIALPGCGWFDEGPQARRLARERSTHHTEVVLDAARLRDEIPTALSAFGEPFADSSAIPCSAIARVARSGLTVVLSGDGGDELFGGYRVYRALAAARHLSRLPAPARSALAALLRPLPARHGGGVGGAVHRARKLLSGIGSDLAAMHAAWMSMLGPAARSALRPGVADRDLGRALVEERHRRFGRGLDGILAVEVDLPLPDDMLAKVDRTSMRHSLEVRTPFLDPGLVELALSLPASAHFSPFAGKRLLRRALRGLVPDRILDAPKRGFEVPVGDWIAGPLAGHFREVVTPASLEAAGGLAAAPVETWLRAHAARRTDHSRILWALFVLCHWHQAIRPSQQAPRRIDTIPRLVSPALS
jgi:asparagine synthase (glutamine-hydrolysing)